MSLPKQLIITNSAYALDGGTTFLSAEDDSGVVHRVVLIQHADAMVSKTSKFIPGRLYFDDDLIPLRSDLESEILNLLRSAELRCEASDPQAGERIDLSSKNLLILGDDIKRVLSNSPEENLRAMLAQVIEFVESPAYVAFAEQVEEAQK